MIGNALIGSSPSISIESIVDHYSPDLKLLLQISSLYSKK